MRPIRFLLFSSSTVFLVSTFFASAAELRIRVVDPHSAAVSGAQVSVYRAGQNRPLEVRNTSGDGELIFDLGDFRLDEQTSLRLQVLAPGFAVESLDLHSPFPADLTVDLHLATASETVVVTATRSPVPGEAAGADVDTLSGGQLATMQPIAADDAMRFLPGAVVNTAGRRGGLSSLFVRGGESNYNKVIVDGVTVNEPGGTFDFGTLSLAQVDRLEFVRGAQSTLYGSDAMTSVVQVWTRTGSTKIPELLLAADGGNLATASGHAALAGARGILDYNLFADQFNTAGKGINDDYSQALQGFNLGAAINPEVSLRVRLRHWNSRTGLPGEWNFNGYVPLVPANGPGEPLVPLAPNPFDRSRYNNLLGSVELAVAAPHGWQHRFTGFDYLYRYDELNPGDPDRVDLDGDPIDYPSHEVDHINRAGFEYQGDYSERTWAHTTFGYRIENENGFVGDLAYGLQNHGQRLNQDTYAQQELKLGRLGIIAGGRFVHDSAFGNTGVPRIALTLLALRGNDTFSGTRLRFSYATGFKEPRLEETFNGLPGPDPYNIPNPGLRPERVRAFEAGIAEGLFQNKYELSATYFNNLFHDQINYVTLNEPPNYPGEYVNVNEAFAQGAEIVLRAKLASRLLLNTAYTFTSSEYLDNPQPYDAVYNPGQPLLRRPKHSGTTLLSYLGNRWGANLSGSFVGRRADSDFYDFGVTHAAGYALVSLGGWRAINSHITGYINLDNALNQHYDEVVGYPALTANFRAGIRLRFGGAR
jgi:vitamin B12 transporter